MATAVGTVTRKYSCSNRRICSSPWKAVGATAVAADQLDPQEFRSQNVSEGPTVALRKYYMSTKFLLL